VFFAARRGKTFSQVRKKVFSGVAAKTAPNGNSDTRWNEPIKMHKVIR
jgi:hypothetical protein